MILFLLKLITVLGTLSAIGYYVVCLLGARSFARSHRKSPPEFMPPISILKPLHGADPQAYENLRSHCVQDYPEFEVIFGMGEPDDETMLIIKRLQREFPSRCIRLVFCPKVLGANRKVSQLIQMLPAARHEYLLINDSDIQVPPHYLREVMAPFQESGVGMVTSLYRGIAERTLGSRLAALGVNTDFIPGVLSAQQVEGGVHFALGATLAFPRRTLEAIGGFDPLVDYLADDFELGFRTAEAGLAVRLADVVVDHHFPPYSFFRFFQHELRWARSTRNSRPAGYFGLILTFGLPWGLLAVMAAGGALWSLALLFLVTSFRIAVVYVVGWEVLRDLQLLSDFWLIPFRDLLALAIWIGGHTGRKVVWRGRKFVVKDRKLRPA